MADFNPQRFLERLHAAGVTGAELQASAVSMSPYRYVYVFLSDVRAPEGDTDPCPHLCISDGAEYGEACILTGRYASFADDGAMGEVDSEDEAFAYVMANVTDESYAPMREGDDPTGGAFGHADRP